MATARGEHEPPRRPCLRRQSQKRTHRQPQLRIRLQRHQRPLPRSIGLSRVPTRSMRRGGLPFGKSHLDHALIESFLAGRESETQLRHLSLFQDSVRDRRQIRDAP